MIWWCEQSSHDLVNTNWQLCITVLKLKSPVLSNICVMQRTLIAVINGVTDFWDKWQISGTNWLTDARLPEDMPAHQALRCHVDLTLGHLPDQSWKHRPGHPNNRWIDQLCRDNSNTPPADLWRRSTTRGHSGVTLRSSMTTHWRWWRALTLGPHGYMSE